MNDTTYVEASVRLDIPLGADPEPVFLALADAYHEFPDATVRDIAFDMSTRDVTMAFTLDGHVAPDEAIRRALGVGRAAFHAAGLDADNDTWELARWTVVPSTGDRSPDASSERAPQPA